MKCIRRLSIYIFYLGIVATGVALWGQQGMQAAGDWLNYDSGCSGEPTLAALLMGSINSRPKAAVAWLEEHRQTQLVVAQPRDEELQRVGLMPNEGPLTKTLLTTYGIASGRITVLPAPQVTNTYGEMQRLIGYAKSLTPVPTQLFILTSWSHSRRAAWTAEHVSRDEGFRICMIPLRYGDDTPVRWWQSDRGMLDVFSEYVKSLRYGIKYAAHV
jgi:uncharacterized SAM-binding protein YcdF (DUF218 family)